MKCGSKNKYDIVKISSVSGLGLDQLKEIVWEKINLK